MYRAVAPPLEVSIKMDLPPEESKERIHEWSFFIERDLKKMEIKTSYQTRKHTIANRRSVDSQKDLSQHNRLSQKYSCQVSPLAISPSKLTSNLSLLHALTHTRSTSEFTHQNILQFAAKDQEKKLKGSNNFLLKSVNNSRKTSLQK